MALTPGTRLGVYDITAPIGEGGMGQVFRAHDTKLNRDVAIKVLPDSFANDEDRLARFTREAQTLAALNHPNIAHVHGLEESSGIRALVMELVEGEDLSARIAHGALPLDEALPIAKQIAEALEAAHEQGIIHRDLKPANIKLRADGTVKVLDFGLARTVDRATGSADQGPGSIENSPTVKSPAMTMRGVILGTVGYMAPEQAKGRSVDRRADVWAFGAVLYEMLTGQRAFTGEDITDTIVSVVSKEPNWGALPATTPAGLRRLLSRCLKKDAKARLQAIGEARAQIDELLSGAPEDASGATTAIAPATLSTRRGRRPWMAAFAVVTILAVALAVPAVRYLRQAPPPAPPETRVDIVTPPTDSPTSFALSPDGRQVVFVASGDGASGLWVRSLATTTVQALAGTEGATAPFWSPDSRSIGFFADGVLKRIDVGGGAPQTVAKAPSARGGTWNADGAIVFAASSSGPLFRVPASGGSPVAVTTLDRQNSHRFPWFLPDGRHVLFYAQGTGDTAGIYLATLDASETHRLTTADAAVVYLPEASGPTGAFSRNGWLLWVRAGALVAQRLDLERQALTGDPVPLADRVVVDPVSSAAAVSASADGLLAYRTGEASRRQLAWVDRSGAAVGVLGAPDENFLGFPSVSPDGRRVVVARTVQGNMDLWLLDGPRAIRFTFGETRDEFPIWSPDGSRIVFTSDRTGRRNLYQKSSSGAGGEELLLASPQDKWATDWSADGRFLLYASSDPQTDRDIWVLPMGGDRTPRLFLQTPFDERMAQFSPDGRWIAYMSNESGRFEICVRPFAEPAASGAPTAGAGAQWQVSTAGGIYPRWRRDGKELYFLAPRGAMMAAPVTATGATLTPGAPVALFTTRIFGGGADAGQGRQYDVSRDGRFLINTLVSDTAWPIKLVQNWHPEAKK